MTEKSGVSWGTVAAVLGLLVVIGGVLWFGGTLIGAIAAL